jgi:hypothetical protein
MFFYSDISVIPPIDCTEIDKLFRTFQYALDAWCIDKIILREDGSNTFETAFGGTNILRVIGEIVGKIGTSISFPAGYLQVPSARRVINALIDYSDDPDNYLKHTITFTNNCWTQLENSGPSPNGNTWKEYCADLGWLTA